MKKLAYYITAHGHGHAARSCDLLAALHRKAPDLGLVVVSAADPAFLHNRLPGVPFELRPESFDAGLVQLDSVRGSAEATLEPALRLMAERGRNLERVTRFLRDARISLVVADIPALPLEAAAREGIPALAVGNFSWNWIYADFAQADPRWSPVVESYAAGYAQADLLIRLPFHEPMSAFRRHVDVPLLSRPGRNRREELAARSGCPLSTRWVLVAVSSLGWTADTLRRLSEMTGYSFWTVEPLRWEGPNFHAADRTVFSFSDVLASCDVVLTKPGYGIVSDCAVNAKPIAYALREGFAEVPFLIEGIRRHLRHAPVPLEDLYAGRIESALETAIGAPAPPDPARAGGEELGARLILDALSHPAAEG
jgi:hypothetical protein